MKTCTKCGKLKVLDDFGLLKSQKDGHAYRCKSCMVDSFNDYKAKYPDRVKKTKSDWSKKNSKSEAARVALYWKSSRGKEVSKVNSSLRRARILQAEGNFTAQDWETLCSFFDNVCVKCGSSNNLEPDHVIPISRGGTNWITNIQPLCRRCNNSKNANYIEYRFSWIEKFWL